jgi:LuxR family maltose regulon positive regulatory protein
MTTSMLFQMPLVVTKFFVPVASHTLISRPRLTTLLEESLKYPLTLVSAPAGFGKTTLLSAWAQSLPPNNPRLAWLSLDEEDNDPHLFWVYVLTALQQRQPERFTPLLMQLQSSQPPTLKYVLTALINLLADSAERFLLILDDYQVITEQQVHTTLLYLIEHLPSQLHIILATRADPSPLLSELRTYQHILEVRADQLRCTVEETDAFFKQVMGILLLEETVQEVVARTEGWLVGLQLFALSQQGQLDPSTLLNEITGNQRYILDYLTQEVLKQQPQEVQTFLLSTSILGSLNASLCDAVMQQSGSQQMLQYLEQANLFIVSLDSKCQWYRYHALFAETLLYQLEHMQGDLIPVLHHRASLWYAQQNQTVQAIVHASHAKEWQWVADLIEGKSRLLLSLGWGPSLYQLTILQHWLGQLPPDVMGSRPRLCVACVNMLLGSAPQSLLEAWLDAAEARLTASLEIQTPQDASLPIPLPQEQLEQQNLLGEVLACRAFLHSYEKEDGQATLALCQRAFALLSTENVVARIFVFTTQLYTCYHSSVNDAMAAVQSGLQGGNLAQQAMLPASAIGVMSSTGYYLLGAGQLHEADQLILQALALGMTTEGSLLPCAGMPAAFHAEILREWNKLDAALSLAKEAVSLGQQVETMARFPYLLNGYAVLLRIFFSLGEWDAALSALQEFERIGRSMNRPSYLFMRSLFVTVDQVRLWLACGELERAIRWVHELDTLAEQDDGPFAHERKDVARVRVLLAQSLPDLALQRLVPVLERATTGQRWGHVIEIQLLQALAHQMRHREKQALDALSEAVRLAEPEGYIRSFVDEGVPMAALLSKLRERQRKYGPTPYLDMLLATFPQQSKTDQHQPKQEREHAQVPSLLDPLSEREREVLQLLVHGSSNQEIAQELVIAVDTVKRHVSHIFSKLGVKNRLQAARQAQLLGLLGEEH